MTTTRQGFRVGALSLALSATAGAVIHHYATQGGSWFITTLAVGGLAGVGIAIGTLVDIVHGIRTNEVELSRTRSDIQNVATGLRQGAIEQSNAKSAFLCELHDELRKAQIRIEYIKYDRADGGAAVFDRSIVEVRRAVRRIQVMTSYLVDVESKSRKPREKYFKAVEGVVGASHGLTYHRLVQYGGVDGRVPMERDYVSHVLWTRRLQDARGNVTVKKMRRLRPTTFMVIDDEVLLWQINGIKEKHAGQATSGEVLEMLGMFVIRDPMKLLTQFFIADFMQYFDHLGEAVAEEDIMEYVE